MTRRIPGSATPSGGGPEIVKHVCWSLGSFLDRKKPYTQICELLVLGRVRDANVHKPALTPSLESRVESRVAISAMRVTP